MKPILLTLACSLMLGCSLAPITPPNQPSETPLPISTPSLPPADFSPEIPLKLTLLPGEQRVLNLKTTPGIKYLLIVEADAASGQNLDAKLGDLFTIDYFGPNSDIQSENQAQNFRNLPGLFHDLQFTGMDYGAYLALSLKKEAKFPLPLKLTLKSETPAPAEPTPAPEITPTPSPLPPLQISAEAQQETLTLYFNQAVDSESIEQALAAYGQAQLPLSIEKGGAGYFVEAKARKIFSSQAFEKRWNAQKTELRINLKTEFQWPTDRDPERQPHYTLKFDQIPELKDAQGFKRNYQFLSPLASSDGQGLELKPVYSPLKPQFTHGRASLNSDLALHFSQPVAYRTADRILAGGSNGNPLQAPVATGSLTKQQVAQNYSLSLERGGLTLFEHISWAAFGGSVEWGTSTSELKLKGPVPLSEALSGVYPRGAELESWPGPYNTDDADANGESLKLSLVTRSWQEVPLGEINLRENLKTAGEVAQDLQAQLREALLKLPEPYPHDKASFTCKADSLGALRLSFEDPQGLFLGFRFLSHFKTSSSQRLPDKWKDLGQAETLPAGIKPPLWQAGDLLTLELAPTLLAPDGDPFEGLSFSLRVES
ncbi:hypothetical protein COW36_11245 [bacterium (Candidatus Blackallbacteria) CG17_big_fil_post_rev_8_21_14_2_50_48_46]|uniref:SbsA Ig-like domain-containing protein n=1 Tax=bacterium (Candidatus Blackallbacteria) CG17_big_fil_post_rev_8_21_14_2_50_48_46 TaxID=2014261 RepID=A0A2M7G4P3_9BACT|nr:MAG: hypothetical protein COW64_18340 [bacterium (Candidatus Blackallbacteria) CG18_big_fil_WC_8_21_14_2_50_49_26]PIW16850.1 MAG: hypothetical protein COW36_11245 [bacterium (Candidatus Blackallbacteria) CG17_big_fil_post_rev_8_21_14_2_50_48_46]PIW48047.1 MAG: hypothetical protein COW20_10960 [bacterium (Candidatus Blackallbacteria) CG13_big_fil_rev_8_21_14_2_50_49_14]